MDILNWKDRQDVKIDKFSICNVYDKENLL